MFLERVAARVVETALPPREQRGVGRERVLNVLRESNQDTMTNRQIAEELPIGLRSVELKMNKLEEEDSGGVILINEETKETTKQWQLHENEPQEPVRDPRVAHGQRLGNQAESQARTALFVGLASLAFAGFLLTSILIARGGNTPIELVYHPIFIQISVFAWFIGILAFLFSEVGYAFAFAVPRIVNWYVEFDELE